MHELIERVQSRQAAPLLAAPTHRHGWIDPITLVERVALVQHRKIPLASYDLVQALLRLAPDRRQEALSAAKNVPGNVGRLLRWALGAARGPEPSDRAEASIWLAAGRAREPDGELDALRLVDIREDLPDAIIPASYHWEPGLNPRRLVAADPPVVIAVAEKPPLRDEGRPPAEPTVLLHQQEGRTYSFGVDTPWHIQWIGSIWPLHREPFLAGGIKPLTARLNMQASSFAPNYAFLEPLLEPDQPWTQMACLAVWIALVSKDADARGAALDALIEAMTDGRADPSVFANVLVRLVAGHFPTINRGADALREVARISPLHAWFVADVLQSFAADCDRLPRDAHHLISLLLETLTDLGLPLATRARRIGETAHRLKASAKLARSLLTLEAHARSEKRREAQLRALEARITRAERWSGSPAPGLADRERSRSGTTAGPQ